MQFRFRRYNEEKDNYDLIALCDVEDYDKLFATLEYMKKHRCDDCIEINTESLVETIGASYYVEGVAFCVDESHEEYAISPHFVVDIA